MRGPCQVTLNTMRRPRSLMKLLASGRGPAGLSPSSAAVVATGPCTAWQPIVSDEPSPSGCKELIGCRYRSLFGWWHEKAAAAVRRGGPRRLMLLQSSSYVLQSYCDEVKRTTATAHTPLPEGLTARSGGADGHHSQKWRAAGSTRLSLGLSEGRLLEFTAVFILLL